MSSLPPTVLVVIDVAIGLYLSAVFVWFSWPTVRLLVKRFRAD